MKVPLVDLRASFQPIRARFLQRLESVLEDMQLFLGPNVLAFEREFAAYCGAAQGVAMASGTCALRAALEASGIGPGDEVIAPSHTFFATIEAIVHAGATPVLVDVEPERLTIDVDEVARSLSSRTRAIVPVHLYGHPAEMDPILDLARARGLRVIEDAAQAHGARYRGRPCGSLGDAGCFSFYFTKNLGALGEGGFVTTRDADIARTLRLLRDHGRVSKYEHALVGHNLRMDELQAVVLRLQLEQLDLRNRRRREIAAAYAARFAGTPIRTLPPHPECDAVHHVYPVRVARRDELAAQLEAHGIGTGIHYRIPAHRQRALHGRAHRCGKMEVTERACEEILSIPIYPELSDEQVDYVASTMLRLSGQGGA
jgi:dTDP-4-amino-4,6-dideoxygalactose transaminase